MADQRKLRPVDGTAVITVDEARLLAAYRTSADDARIDIIAAAEAMAEVSPRIRRHRLSLVTTSGPGGAR